MAIVKAQLNNLRQSPRKVRLIVNLVRGKGVLKALQQLEFVIRRPALPVSKLLRSAIANAENTYDMVASNLYIKEFYVDEGVKLKRYQPKAMGAVGEIQKKTSHIHLVLAEKVPGLKADPSTKTSKVSKKDVVAHDHDHGNDNKEEVNVKSTSPTGPEKPVVKSEIGKKSEVTNTKRRFFQRKSI
jgi:large subunit ribosomal protein L22